MALEFSGLLALALAAEQAAAGSPAATFGAATSVSSGSSGLRPKPTKAQKVVAKKVPSKAVKAAEQEQKSRDWKAQRAPNEAEQKEGRLANKAKEAALKQQPFATRQQPSPMSVTADETTYIDAFLISFMESEWLKRLCSGEGGKSPAAIAPLPLLQQL